MAAPAAERAAMSGDGEAELNAATEAEAIGGGIAVGKAHRRREARIERLCVIATGINMALPGDHVVERGAEPGIAGPQNMVLRRAKPARNGALVPLGTIRQSAGIGGEERGTHASLVENAAMQQLGKA